MSKPLLYVTRSAVLGYQDILRAQAPELEDDNLGNGEPSIFEQTRRALTLRLLEGEPAPDGSITIHIPEAHLTIRALTMVSQGLRNVRKIVALPESEASGNVRSPSTAHY